MRTIPMRIPIRPRRCAATGDPGGALDVADSGTRRRGRGGGGGGGKDSY